MKQIFLIAKKEFLNKISNPWFIWSAVLVPIGITVIYKFILKYNSIGGYIFNFSIVIGVLILTSIFMYGNMLVYSIIEEKLSRVLDITISVVDPLKLLAGKILGLGFVTIIQFIIWIIFSHFVISLTNIYLDKNVQPKNIMTEIIHKMIK